MNLHNGDCLVFLKSLPDNSIDSVVTDPPYGISFMGKKWDYAIPSVEVWKECLRVLKPGGHALIACGTRTQHRMAVNIEDAGFEIRDVITWLYGSGFPKSHNLDGDHKGWGTALKPACEFWTLARKPLSEKTVAENVQKWGTGAVNIDASRITMDKSKERRFDLEKCAGDPTYGVKKNNPNTIGGSFERLGELTQQRFKMGRWPANLILDEEAGEQLDLMSGECKSAGKYKEETLKKNIKSISIFGVGDRRPVLYSNETGGASRFFYCAKASKSERGEDNKHPTVKPIKLMSYLCKLITPPNGTVLDPFMGSGTTGIAAKKEGFEFIGCELDEQYFEIAKNRINKS